MFDLNKKNFTLSKKHGLQEIEQLKSVIEDIIRAGNACDYYFKVILRLSLDLISYTLTIIYPQVRFPI